VSHDAAPAILVAAAAILVAVLGLRASTLAGDASGALESAVRVEVKHGAADVQDALVVFDEAPFAARAAAVRFRSEELAREAESADPATKQELTVEAAVAGVVAQSLAAGTDGDEALDVDRRLRERRALQELGPESAGELAADGDGAGRRAALMALAAVPAGIAFLFGSLGQAFRRGRGLLVALGVVALLVALAAGIWVEAGA
jgi:hypothetical protein